MLTDYRHGKSANHVCNFECCGNKFFNRLGHKSGYKIRKVRRYVRHAQKNVIQHEIMDGVREFQEEQKYPLWMEIQDEKESHDEVTDIFGYPGDSF